MLAPVGQVVGVAVGDVGEGAGLGREIDGRHRAAAGVPAQRRLAHDLGVEADRISHLRALGSDVVVLVVDPLEAMAGDLPAGLAHRLDLRGRARQGRRDTIDGERHVVPGEEPMQAPEPGPGSVLVDRFHAPVPLAGPGLGTHDLREERLGRGIAVQQAVLAALLVVQHELDGDPGTLGPIRRRRPRPVAQHVARIAHRTSAHSPAPRQNNPADAKKATRNARGAARHGLARPGGGADGAAWGNCLIARRADSRHHSNALKGSGAALGDKSRNPGTTTAIVPTRVPDDAVMTVDVESWLQDLDLSE